VTRFHIAIWPGTDFRLSCLSLIGFHKKRLFWFGIIMYIDEDEAWHVLLRLTPSAALWVNCCTSLPLLLSRFIIVHKILALQRPRFTWHSSQTFIRLRSFRIFKSWGSEGAHPNAAANFLNTSSGAVLVFLLGHKRTLQFCHLRLLLKNFELVYSKLCFHIVSTNVYIYIYRPLYSLRVN